MIKKILTPLAILLLLTTAACKQRYPDLEDGLYAEFVTNKDTMVAKLFFNKVPLTVANFVALAEGTHPLVAEEFKGKPFYDGLTFHRVMNNFMIQGGDHTATGSGNPGYRFTADFDSSLKHNKPGILSMANGGGWNTNSSQFFITEAPYPNGNAFLSDGNLKPCDQPRVSCHSVFGELVIGIEVQDAISNVQVGIGNKPVEDVIISKLNIIRIGSAAKKFDAAKVFTEELPNAEKRIEDEKAEKIELAEQAKTKAKEGAKAAKDQFLKNNADLKGRRFDSPTGMAMIFTNEKQNGVKPNTSQRVLIDCAGYLENGNLFWTTWKAIAKANGKYDETQEQRGGYAPFDMPYNERATLVAGFREAMLKMNIGDKAKVFIPSFLGYGESGRAPLIQPNTNLIFEIELVGIKGK